uniref:DEP domain containing 7, paralog a n=1 Tax=Eptatretus burgeri TaxID=7764 RepID=A0A8C4NL95_EPTBU
MVFTIDPHSCAVAGLNPLCAGHCPCKATRTWRDLVEALHTVHLRRHRVHFRSYKNCFTGMDAVDTILAHLMHADYFRNCELSRLKVVGNSKGDGCVVFMLTFFSIVLPREGIVSVCLSAQNFSVSPQLLVEQVWRQQTLLCLLQLTDLQVIDTVLISSPSARKTCRGCLRGKLSISNEALESLLDRNFNLDSDWLAAALDCLDWLPNSRLVELAQQLPNNRLLLNTDEVKLLLFNALARHYEQEKQPLLSSQLYEVHAAVLQLLDKGQSNQALEASQLWLRLLESPLREELRVLLHFMNIASSPDAFRIRKQMDNRSTVRRVFGKAIIQNKVFSLIEVDTFLNFLIDNHAYLFKVGGSSKMTVRRCALMLSPPILTQFLPTDFTYCQQVSQRAFEQQQKEATVAELSGLLKTITNNPNLPLEKKRNLVSEFQTHHPSVVVEHLSLEI